MARSVRRATPRRPTSVGAARNETKKQGSPTLLRDRTNTTGTTEQRYHCSKTSNDMVTCYDTYMRTGRSTYPCPVDWLRCGH